MKKYTIVLTGGKALEVDKERRDFIEQVWKNKSERLISIDGNTISAAMIRGIFEKDVEDLSGSTAHFRALHEAFEEDCKQLSNLPMEEKIKRELETRVFPSALMALGWIMKDVDTVYENIKKTIHDFFVANPKYPRCPARFWFPTLKPYVNPSVSEFYKVVGRNDEEIQNWTKRNGIRLVLSFQVLPDYNDIPF
jgi:hypothetical protein